VPLERFSAAWREAYVREATAEERRGDTSECVFCQLLAQGVSEETGVFVVTDTAFGVLNAFPYGSGHVLVLPKRHVADLVDLDDDEAADYFSLLRRVTGAIHRAYQPDGMNIGFNLGRAAGAGIPQHLHGHLLPRWSGDTNFMTSLGETRVLPESLGLTWRKIHAEI
jgi:ATP adenylyltransferase